MVKLLEISMITKSWLWHVCHRFTTTVVAMKAILEKKPQISCRNTPRVLLQKVVTKYLHYLT